MGYRLAIDLGTAFTAAAIRQGSEEPAMVGLGNRTMQIPSVLYLEDDGRFQVGEAAERRGVGHPERLVREFKRRLGDPVPMMVGEQFHTAEDLTAVLLRWVYERCQARLGERPQELVLTHPANWGLFKLQRLAQVAEAAGVENVFFCTEPEAAAVQYAAKASIQPGDRIAVYDLGGGTFDACVLEKQNTGFRRLGEPRGVDSLGGTDFDSRVFDYVVNVLDDRIAELDHEHPDTLAGLARLRRDCVEAKESLSEDTDAVIAVSLPGVVTSVRVTRSELEAGMRDARGRTVRDELAETVNEMLLALRSANVTASDLRALVLVGGSSQMPLVGELLQRNFGVPVALDVHPKHDVALGAARIDIGASSGVHTEPGPTTAAEATGPPGGIAATEPHSYRNDSSYRSAVVALRERRWSDATSLLEGVAVRFPDEERVAEQLSRARHAMLPAAAPEGAPAARTAHPELAVAGQVASDSAPHPETGTAQSMTAKPITEPTESTERADPAAAFVIDPIAPSRPARPASGGRLVAVVVMAVLLIAAVLGVRTLAGDRTPPASEPSANPTPDLQLPPGTPTVTAKPEGGRVQFTWAGYPNERPSDRYRLDWREPPNDAPTLVDKPSVTVSNRTEPCLRVSVRVGGRVGEYSKWSCAPR